MAVKESVMWLASEIQEWQAGTPMLGWVFSCGTGQEEIPGLWDAFPPTIKMVMDEGNVLDGSLSSLITRTDEPSEVSPSVGEERNKLPSNRWLFSLFHQRLDLSSSIV